MSQARFGKFVILEASQRSRADGGYVGCPLRLHPASKLSFFFTFVPKPRLDNARVFLVGHDSMLACPRLCYSLPA